MTTLKDVKNNPQVLGFVKQTEKTLSALSYTDHGLRHLNLVADRAINIAKSIGISEREQELSAIAAFCHDMGNFLSRSHHNYFAALLFHQIFKDDFAPDEMASVMQAISNHDKQQEDINFVSKIAAIIVLADKSDVHRSRVTVKKMKDIKSDIHDRVNYATTESDLKVDTDKKRITLSLEIDTNFVPILEYFEIFTERMVFCRKAAEFLGYNFGLVINKTKLL
ncbi:MAG: HD domain-containing protein [bacterium]|nr:HD domain-containing protein [bacterium]